MQLYDMPDARGHFGQYGGTFVAETLVEALEELRVMYEKYRHDPEFLAEFAYDLKHFVGRPSPIYHAKRLSDKVGGAQRRRYIRCSHLQRVPYRRFLGSWFRARSSRLPATRFYL